MACLLYTKLLLVLKGIYLVWLTTSFFLSSICIMVRNVSFTWSLFWKVITYLVRVIQMYTTVSRTLTPARKSASEPEVHAIAFHIPLCNTYDWKESYWVKRSGDGLFSSFSVQYLIVTLQAQEHFFHGDCLTWNINNTNSRYSHYVNINETLILYLLLYRRSPVQSPLKERGMKFSTGERCKFEYIYEDWLYFSNPVCDWPLCDLQYSFSYIGKVHVPNHLDISCEDMPARIDSRFCHICIFNCSNMSPEEKKNQET